MFAIMLVIILMLLRIIIGSIIISVLFFIIPIIINNFYKKANNKGKDNDDDNYIALLFFIYLMFIIIIITTSFISPNGSEHAYSNRIGFINVTQQDRLHWNPNYINKSQLNKIKNYHLVSKNHKYEYQRQSIIKKVQYHLRYKKKNHNSNG